MPDNIPPGHWLKKLLALLAAVLLGWTARWYWEHRQQPPGPPGGTGVVCAAPTGNATSAMTVPGLEFSLNGSPLPSQFAHFTPPTLMNKLTFKNATASPITMNATKLFQNVGGVDVASDTLPVLCQYMAVPSNDCVPGGVPKTLAPGESCDLTFSAVKVQTGYITYQTSAGNGRVVLSVHP